MPQLPPDFAQSLLAIAFYHQPLSGIGLFLKKCFTSLGTVLCAFLRNCHRLSPGPLGPHAAPPEPSSGLLSVVLLLSG